MACTPSGETGAGGGGLTFDLPWTVTLVLLVPAFQSNDSFKFIPVSGRAVTMVTVWP